MSTDYYLACDKHKEYVGISTDGMSGPMLNCDWSLAYFVVTHANCDLKIYQEQSDIIEDYKEWTKENKEKLLEYSKE